MHAFDTKTLNASSINSYSRSHSRTQRNLFYIGSFSTAWFSFRTALINSLIFSDIASSEKLALPIPACTTPPFSALNSTAPDLEDFTASETSLVTVQYED
ncbi:MAG: hypothetical protein CM15mP109_10250 [Candidatus Dadabacteria bacterium]|nr:MAG: hypothetical protein CM15mP109_10250 [Candidatus Dadabacteria bacterium]